MSRSDWKTVAELAGIAAIIASLLFVGMQLRQEQQIAIADTYASPTESAGTLAELIGIYPEVWRNGLDGTDLSPPDELRFRAMVEAVETHFFNMSVRFARLEINDPALIAQSFAFAIYCHPGLRRQYEFSRSYNEAKDAAFADSGGSNGPFRARVDTYLDMLDRELPAVPAENDYVFW